ncbi:17.4 kDa class I heat shock protein-like [Momordica charantia]|uniref:17.4 kDa class I heat shock protein-like n=1 Tax=Momordica charantia TaxID=3673 RepID=A0A6J1BX32_MOMCH|nr:17.4 kDa class I heat shock protein-like [Momordica charantia]
MSLIPSFFGRRSNVFDQFPSEIWDPFEGWPNRSLSGPFRSCISSETASFAHAHVDWKETQNAHVFKADVPGLKKEEVKVEVEDRRVLRISGQRSKETKEKGDSWHRVERSSGQFSRMFRLPENAKVDEIKATMENGVLTVTVPKVEKEKKPNVKSVEISS